MFLIPPVWKLPYSHPHCFFPNFPISFSLPFFLSLPYSQSFPAWEYDYGHSLLYCIAFAREPGKIAQNLYRYSRPFNRVSLQTTISEKWPPAQRFDILVTDRRSLIQVLIRCEAAWLGWSTGTGHLHGKMKNSRTATKLRIWATSERFSMVLNKITLTFPTKLPD